MNTTELDKATQECLDKIGTPDSWDYGTITEVFIEGMKYGMKRHDRIPERPECHTVEEWMESIKNADPLTKDIFSKGPYDVLYDVLNRPYQHCYDAIKEFGELCFQVGAESTKGSSK